MTAPATETADVPTSSATTPAVPQAPASPLERFGSRKVMAALVVGVLALQLGFILSYVAAFHQPTPRDISVAVVAGPGVPAGIPQQSVDKLNALDGRPVDARTAVDTAEVRQLLREREIQGAYVIAPNGTDTLITASAGGSSIASALESVFGQVAQSQDRQLVVRDEIPVGAHDNRGLSGFYLSIGWVVGGYLLAAAIGLIIGAPATLRQAWAHVAVMFGYSVVSGALGALITTHVLGTFAGHWFPLWILGTGVVFATGLFTLGLRAAVGILAVPLAIAVFVVLGNPSAGGAFGANVIPSFYAAIGKWITPGAGTEGVRSIVYFDNVGLGQPTVALALYTAVGAVLLLGFTAWRSRRTVSSSADTAAPAAK
ncbi:ABC-2 transporter permease [Prescottella equi]|uniref:Integral membrane protein n=1 Tax=Rhodococcus hoagii TaxID=43767 RepID=A0AAE5CET4_RHOHA|nr:hypothetical protein C7H75_03035 [Prescottella equi]MBU4617106.1 hypothetical protein [Rhodococcus sp. GG48]MBM4524851.1 hypothetical protein [Prescottella equi]MBM4650657.1 hypothetical protein [Prescottella equi]MBM4683748.1 hypothetical protein [Prescottella equi]